MNYWISLQIYWARIFEGEALEYLSIYLSIYLSTSFIYVHFLTIYFEFIVDS